LTAAELNDDWLDDASIFHFGSLSLSAEPCRTAALEAARRVKEAGGVISYHPNLRADMWPDAETMCREVLAHIGLADVVKVNERELLTLTGLEPAEAVQQLLDLGAKAVVVTRGQEGCCVITQQAMTAIPGMRVKSVDTAGAGDSFVGAMLLKLIEHGATEDMLEAVLTDEQLVRDIFGFANAAGAITTTRYGTIPAMPTMAEIEGLYSSSRYA
jgi:fructokinase